MIVIQYALGQGRMLDSDIIIRVQCPCCLEFTRC